MLDEWRASVPGEGDRGTETVALPGRPAAFAGAEAVRYATELADPRSEDDDVAVLHLDGCFAHTSVELEGTVIGHDGDGPITRDAYFDPLRIPFRPAEDERIVVTCEAPQDRFGGLFDSPGVPEAVAVPAVWWDAHVETRPLPCVDSVSVRPELTDDGARLNVRTTVLTDEAIDDRITYSLRPAGELQTRGTMNRGSVETSGPGRTTVSHTIEVMDPALWWPRGYGDQHRYTLRAKLGDSEATATTGIRAVERAEGALRVNGQDVPIRGVGLVTADPGDVERAVECNANLVRAQAHVLPPSVYEACDEAGILVWQDLPLTGPGAFDVDRGGALAKRLVERRGGHPSLAAVGVHDAPTEAFADGLGSGLLDRLRLRWRAWRTDYDPEPAEQVGDAVPGDLPVVPVVGDPGTDPDALRLFPGWDYGEAADVDALLERYPADVVAAFGTGALAAAGGGGDADRDVAGFDRAKHDARVDVGDGEDVDASQAHQATVVRTVAEGLRRERTGAIVHALRDPDVGAGLGVYAVDGEAKAAREALATAYEPLQAFLIDPTAAETEIVVRNDGPTAISGEVTWRAGEDSGTLDVTVDAGGRWRGGPVSLPEDAPSVHLEVTAPASTAESRYDRT